MRTAVPETNCGNKQKITGGDEQMSKKGMLSLFLVSLLMLSFIAGCAAPTAAPPEASHNGKVKVFGAFATPIEEPWDGVIHAALLKAKDEGKIEYTYTEDIGYSGDMERVLREVSEQQKPQIIFGDAFGNEEAVRRVAADYPEIAFVFGSGLGPADPNFAVFDNWIHEPAYLAGMLAGG
jgi:basic membrane protein A and related proteins